MSDFDDFSEFLSYDPATGVLTWKKSPGRRRKAGDRAGYMDKSTKREKLMFRGRPYLLYRVAWLLHTGNWPVGDLDHKNGNGYDNRFANLREATPSLNAQNRSARGNKNNGTGLIGAYWAKREKKFTATIGFGRKTFNLGYFGTAKEAHAAYTAAKKLLHTFQLR